MTTDTMTKPLTAFTHVSFDVVGTLIDFERAITGVLTDIAREAGVRLDGEAALSVYREARHDPEAGLFPDDMGRCYGRIAAEFGLPDNDALRARAIDAVGDAAPFPDSKEALARLAARYRLIAMTNARRWAFDRFSNKLGIPSGPPSQPTTPARRNLTRHSFTWSSAMSDPRAAARMQSFMPRKASIMTSACRALWA